MVSLDWRFDAVPSPSDFSTPAEFPTVDLRRSDHRWRHDCSGGALTCLEIYRIHRTVLIEGITVSTTSGA